MKQFLLAALLVCFEEVSGQGTIYFNNGVHGLVVAPIFSNEPSDPFLAKTGNRAGDYPAGTQTYGGTGLTASPWVVQLFAGAVGTPDQSLLPVFPVTSFRTGIAAGFINGIQLVIGGVVQGEKARLQVRVFDSSTGSSYDLSLNRGASDSFDSRPLGGGIFPPPNIVGLTSFNVYVVPEPSTTVYILVALLVFASRCRSQSRFTPVAKEQGLNQDSG